MTEPIPMTDDELTAIEARYNAATPGPWGFPPCSDVINESLQCAELHAKSMVAADCIVQSEQVPFLWNVDVIWVEGNRLIIRPANADFIAHAREDIPDLVAEVRRLREQLRKETT